MNRTPFKWMVLLCFAQSVPVWWWQCDLWNLYNARLFVPFFVNFSTLDLAISPFCFWASPFAQCGKLKVIRLYKSIPKTSWNWIKMPCIQCIEIRRISPSRFFWILDRSNLGTVHGLDYTDEMPVKVTLKHPKGVCGYAVCDLLRVAWTWFILVHLGTESIRRN